MKPESSDYFVVSAVIVEEAKDRALRGDLARIREEVGRAPGSSLHFRNMNHMTKVKVTSDIGLSPNVAAVTSVIMCKRHINDAAYPGGAAFISGPDPMYLFGLRMLWERVSWCVRDHGAGPPAKLTFSQVKHFKIEKIEDYRSRLEKIETHIHWPSFAGHPFVMRGMEEIELLQMADSSASAVAAAIEPNKHGDTEDRYLRNLAPKLYRYGTSALTTYGLRVFPPALAKVGGPLHHFNDY